MSFWCGNKDGSLSIVVNVQILHKHDEEFMMNEIIALIQLHFIKPHCSLKAG